MTKHHINQLSYLNVLVWLKVSNSKSVDIVRYVDILFSLFQIVYHLYMERSTTAPSCGKMRHLLKCAQWSLDCKNSFVEWDNVGRLRRWVDQEFFNCFESYPASMNRFQRRFKRYVVGYTWFMRAGWRWYSHSGTAFVWNWLTVFSSAWSWRVWGKVHTYKTGRMFKSAHLPSHVTF